MMMKKTKIVWRLSKLPVVDELWKLVESKIITQDEAREILFSSETEEDRDKKSLESEIKFLRELVEKLANSQKIIEIIREIEKPYRPYYWYQGYRSWTSGNGVSYGTIGITTSDTSNPTVGSSSNFSDIKTF